MTDFVVIGGGIAGVAAAAYLSPRGSVIVLDKEPTLSYHTTGRSAAVFTVNYGSEGFRPLALASRDFLENPPEGAADEPLLSDRGVIWAAEVTQMEKLRSIADDGTRSGAGSELLTAADVVELVPAMRPDRVAGGVYEPQARDMDVAGLHQAFVRMARSNGTSFVTTAAVTSLQREGNGWLVSTGGSQHHCGAVVNAAGAWGDEVAALAGIEPVGLQPMRRTAFMVPGDSTYSEWPMVVDAEQRFYFKPDGVQLLCSLAEEEPSPPCDPKPRMEDVALAIERINQATNLDIRTVNSEWTGLRTFAPDRELVLGEEPTAPGFFWLVGQGGTGIATAPAYGALLALLATRSDVPPAMTEAGVDPRRYDPARFRA